MDQKWANNLPKRPLFGQKYAKNAEKPKIGPKSSQKASIWPEIDGKCFKMPPKCLKMPQKGPNRPF